MKQQLWRLRDLRDGGGLGYTVELFFLALRQLESNEDFYKDAFEDLVSQWMDGKGSFGTHQILLNLICDLVIQGRGIFSDHTYPGYIIDRLLTLADNILEEYTGRGDYIDDAVHELQVAALQDCFDNNLRNKALRAIIRFRAA
jgi:hypothetical protein